MKHKNIKRILCGRTKGWQVAIRRNHQDYTKMFSDNSYGGKQKALAEAIRYRNKLLKQLAKELPSLQLARTKSKRNKTGVVGLQFTSEPRKDGTLRHYISAFVRPRKGKSVQKRFRVIDGDFNSAIEEAKAWREEVIAARRLIESFG
jgi:hypothetical protein